MKEFSAASILDRVQKVLVSDIRFVDSIGGLLVSDSFRYYSLFKKQSNF